MTDQELKDLVASLAVENRETSRVVKESLRKTSRIVEEAALSIKETVQFIKENQKETSLFIKESQKETSCIVRESILETGNHLKELKDDLKELARRMGGIDDNQGFHAEQYFQNALSEKPVFGGIKYDEMVPNLAYKDRDGEIEFDIALVNGDSIALIEVKNRIHPKFVRELAENRIKMFREFFPKYKKFKTYLGIAGFSFSKKTTEEAKKYGIGLIRQVGDSVEIKAERLKVY